METDLLAELIERKFQLMVQYYQLGIQQLDVVQTGDMTELLKLLSVKQKLLEDIQATERELDPFRGQAPESRRWRNEEQRRQCADWIEQAEALYREILEHEKQSEKQLCIRRDDVARKLQGAHFSGQARQAYVTHSEAHTGNLDLSTER